MKQALLQASNYNELYTPEIAIFPLLKHIPKEGIYWECTDFGGSKITEVLEKSGRKVVVSHINSGVDFFKDTIDTHFDYIITNPPYSLKDKFLQRAYEIGKPFCFLLPITALEGVRRGELYRKYGVQVLVLDRRVDFTGKKSNWFNVSWFCWKMLPKDLIFERVNK